MSVENKNEMTEINVEVFSLTMDDGEEYGFLILDKFLFEEKEYIVVSEFNDGDDIDDVIDNSERFLFGLGPNASVEILDEETYDKVVAFYNERIANEAK